VLQTKHCCQPYRGADWVPDTSLCLSTTLSFPSLSPSVLPCLSLSVPPLSCLRPSSAATPPPPTHTHTHTHTHSWHTLDISSQKGATLLCLIACSSSADCCLRVYSAYTLTHTGVSSPYTLPLPLPSSLSHAAFPLENSGPHTTPTPSPLFFLYECVCKGVEGL